MSELNEIIQEAGVDNLTMRQERRRIAFVQQVKEYLEEEGLSQAELAQRMGKEDSQISRLLSPEGNPTLETIAEVESALERDIFTFHRNIKYKFKHRGSKENIIDEGHIYFSVESEEKKAQHWKKYNKTESLKVPVDA